MGYINWSMSERAAEAYDNGERPLTQWSKAEILESLKYNLKDESLLPYFEKLTLKTLRFYCLQKTAWHHTGKFFNQTNFYALDTEFLENKTIEDIQRWKEEEEQEAEERKAKRAAKPANLYITALIMYTKWIGTRKHPRAQEVIEVVYFRSNDKLISTNNGKKRLSSIRILKQVEQKTKYANAKKVAL